MVSQKRDPNPCKRGLSDGLAANAQRPVARCWSANGWEPQSASRKGPASFCFPQVSEEADWRWRVAQTAHLTTAGFDHRCGVVRQQVVRAAVHSEVETSVLPSGALIRAYPAPCTCFVPAARFRIGALEQAWLRLEVQNGTIPDKQMVNLGAGSVDIVSVMLSAFDPMQILALSLEFCCLQVPSLRGSWTWRSALETKLLRP